jgi:PhnB protein
VVTRSRAVPKRWHSVTSRLVVRDPAKLVLFLKKAFGATGTYRANSPAQIKIGDSIVMVSEVGPRKLTSSFFYLYVQDVEATYKRALRAGATSLERPMDMPYGDRRAMVKDPCGNDWQIAAPKVKHRSGTSRRRP